MDLTHHERNKKRKFSNWQRRLVSFPLLSQNDRSEAAFVHLVEGFELYRGSLCFPRSPIYPMSRVYPNLMFFSHIAVLPRTQLYHVVLAQTIIYPKTHFPPHGVCTSILGYLTFRCDVVLWFGAYLLIESRTSSLGPTLLVHAVPHFNLWVTLLASLLKGTVLFLYELR